MKSIPTSRAERNDPQEREDLIREVTKMVRQMSTEQLRKVRWNILRKWGA